MGRSFRLNYGTVCILMLTAGLALVIASFFTGGYDGAFDQPVAKSNTSHQPICCSTPGSQPIYR